MHSNPYGGPRRILLAFATLLWLILAQIPSVVAAPIGYFSPATTAEHPKPPDDPSLWLYLSVAAALVLSGGAFAGLTIALMGQDEMYLQVIQASGEGAEKKHAASVLRLLKKGKHWVLVTLLLSNVIVNETLPIVLDRSLGGGWPAVLGSTALIVIFGEVVPQSICVRYGLPIGAWMAPCVLVLMYIMSPIAWPIAKLLDKLLGEDHGTYYKKAGLKTLVTLHENLGTAGEQLNSDEVTIITAVLDLKEKSVGSIMIPMEDVFTMSADDVLDEKTMDLILSQGYSRIPIHAPDNTNNFVGMLLVKMLITYDPEDCKQVRDFALATLPETRAETSCLDIVNFFQEGKSHMVLVSEYPGEDHGALGVVTLEDVIEELIGEEIIDESDVFIDVHKAIRRLAPAPKSRVPKGKIVTEPPQIPPPRPQSDIDGPEDGANKPEPQAEQPLIPKPSNPVTEYASPPHTTFYMRRPRAIAESGESTPIARRAPTAEIREHLKHLGPSNLASRPRQTRYNNVKIKRGSLSPSRSSQTNYEVVDRAPSPDSARRASETASLLGVQNGIKSGGKTASDAIRALRASYGTIADQPPASTVESESTDHPHTVNKAVGTGDDLLDVLPEHLSHRRSRSSRERVSVQSDHVRSPSRASDSAPPTPPYITRGPTRTGSITEQYVDSNGIRKVILETSDSYPPSDEDLISRRSSAEKQPTEGEDTEGHRSIGSATQGKNKKRSRKKKDWRSTDQTAEDDSKPLLDL